MSPFGRPETTCWFEQLDENEKYLYLTMRIKRAVRRWFRQMGLDVRRFNSQNSEWFRLARLLHLHGVHIIVDVGANIGQFAESIRDSGFSGRIVSFEAATVAHSELSKRARGDSRWTIAPRVALGDHDGTVLLNIAGNSASSSVLPMLPSHVSAEPSSRYVGSEMANLRRLDSVSRDFVSPADRVFLKLDVQGYEYNVLQGAQHLLKRVVGIQLELSLVPLYEGEHLFHPMLHYLEEHGFDLWSVNPGFIDPNTFRLLQLDAVLFRKKCASTDERIVASDFAVASR